MQAPGKKQGLSSKNVWRASRQPSRCEAEDKNNDGDFTDEGEIDNLTKKSHPHYKKGSTRTYGCIYNGAQILYWAYFVPSGGGKGGNGGGGGGHGGGGGGKTDKNRVEVLGSGPAYHGGGLAAP
jgi:hypothetical protein